MTKENIALTLKKLRENARLSVKDVQKDLSDRGVDVSIKTIYGWESGHRLPDADTFLTLCSVYNSIDILSDFGYAKRMMAYNLGLNAANQDNDATDEDLKHDDSIMNDDNEWK